MTTIAWDENTVAWDSQITVGDEKYISPDPQKVVVRRGNIFMLAGHAGMLSRTLIPWWEGGHKDVDAPGGEWDLAVITRSGVFMYNSEAPGQEVSVPRTFAMGSGSMAARAALGCNVGATRAVELACEIDVSSGGPVHSITISKHIANKSARRTTTRVKRSNVRT